MLPFTEFAAARSPALLARLAAAGVAAADIDKIASLGNSHAQMMRARGGMAFERRVAGILSTVQRSVDADGTALRIVPQSRVCPTSFQILREAAESAIRPDFIIVAEAAWQRPEPLFVSDVVVISCKTSLRERLNLDDWTHRAAPRCYYLVSRTDMPSRRFAASPRRRAFAADRDGDSFERSLASSMAALLLVPL
jgi:hypothetical protein